MQPETRSDRPIRCRHGCHPATGHSAFGGRHAPRRAAATGVRTAGRGAVGLALMGLALLGLLSGCGGTGRLSRPVDGRAFKGVVVRVHCAPGGPVGLLRRYTKSWSARTGAEVRVLGGTEEAKDVPDALVIRACDLGRVIRSSPLRSVPEALLGRESQYRWSDLAAVYRTHLLLWGGRPVALPMLGEDVVCCYRSDRFGDAAAGDRYRAATGGPLRPPTTWQEMAAVAEAFAPRPGGTAGQAGTYPPLPTSDHALVTEFYRTASSFVREAVGEQVRPKPGQDRLYSFEFGVEIFEPRVDGPGFVEALRLLKALQPCRPDSGPAADPCEAFLDGRAVVCLATPGWVRRFAAEGSAVRGRFGIVPAPGSSTVTGETGAIRRGSPPNAVPFVDGGWVGVVPEAAAAADAAFDLLADFGGPTTGLQVLLDPESAGAPFRGSQLDNRTAWDAFGLDQDLTTRLHAALSRQLLHPGVIDPVVCLRVRRRADYETALASALRTCLGDPRADPAAALAGAARAWREIAADTGGADVRDNLNEYRLSVGLEPR